jgi:hypothetical protein
MKIFSYKLDSEEEDYWRRIAAKNTFVKRVKWIFPLLETWLEIVLNTTNLLQKRNNEIFSLHAYGAI